MKNGKGVKVIMGSLEQGDAIPQGAQVDYTEGYLDAVAWIKELHARKPNMSIEDLCLLMETSMRTFLRSGDVVTVPDNLSHYPTVAKLLNRVV